MHVTLSCILPRRSVWSHPHRLGTDSLHFLCTFISQAAKEREVQTLKRLHCSQTTYKTIKVGRQGRNECMHLKLFTVCWRNCVTVRLAIARLCFTITLESLLVQSVHDGSTLVAKGAAGLVGVLHPSVRLLVLFKAIWHTKTHSNNVQQHKNIMACWKRIFVLMFNKEIASIKSGNKRHFIVIKPRLLRQVARKWHTAQTEKRACLLVS